MAAASTAVVETPEMTKDDVVAANNPGPVVTDPSYTDSSKPVVEPTPAAEGDETVKAQEAPATAEPTVPAKEEEVTPAPVEKEAPAPTTTESTETPKPDETKSEEPAAAAEEPKKEETPAPAHKEKRSPLADIKHKFFHHKEKPVRACSLCFERHCVIDVTLHTGR